MARFALLASHDKIVRVFLVVCYENPDSWRPKVGEELSPTTSADIVPKLQVPFTIEKILENGSFYFVDGYPINEMLYGAESRLRLSTFLDDYAEVVKRLNQ